MATQTSFSKMAEWIEEAHPGTKTHAIPMYEGVPMSWIPLATQVEEIIKHIRGVVSEDETSYEARGYHFVTRARLFWRESSPKAI
mmetsp:Transcript_26721/g.64768  ORF Transcript_26721/g.64768 Transcript_26721/m.64768 type:complete len:85 (+) Transcript_26721:207-461(+)